MLYQNFSRKTESDMHHVVYNRCTKDQRFPVATVSSNIYCAEFCDLGSSFFSKYCLINAGYLQVRKFR